MRNKLKAESGKQKAACCSTGAHRHTSSVIALTGFLLFAFCFQLSCSNTDPKFKQYYNQGEELYTQHCSNCHQKNGQGLGRVYPPLASSDYLKNNFNDVVCLMRNGVSGSIIVNGKEFNQAMPGVPTLSDLEIAEIATYIYNTWDSERGLVDIKEVSPVLENCEK